ncbi:hypothetical protein CFC21_099401 [Triticum aestivum]|uniref:F-box domain-containing protein n=2 Tax=Triticum aestivum TaxID=4565 RepID=A0A9R1FFF4_WHEAT|nr:hypothetical protein CFC21_038985 [Triticum aestivum]KAF7097602.1 hypothetical protein CFC21_099401 [Triticum aestivum]CDM86565.1 unnamed protein product [Triticum aestivum]
MRLRPKVHASEEASTVIRSNRHISPARLASPLEDDNLLREILLRLPPRPSSLPRASAVCKRWQRASTDPRFHRQFHEYHQKPPLLGFFEDNMDGIMFRPILDHPDRIPSQCFDLRAHVIDNGNLSRFQLLGCRHGRLLIMRPLQQDLIVIAPITDEECRVSIPPEFNKRYVNGAVLYAAADHGHVHGSCHLSPFKVVLLSTSTYYSGPQLVLASVYSSEAGIWGDVISTPTPCELRGASIHGSLVGNALYWLFEDYMIEFHLDGHILALIDVPPTINEARRFLTCMRSSRSWMALLVSPYCLTMTITFKCGKGRLIVRVLPNGSCGRPLICVTLMGSPHGVKGERQGLLFRLRYTEDSDDIILYVGPNVYIIQLKSMQSKKLCGTRHVSGHHSFKSFCMPGDCSSLVLAS